jgi:2-polyprenyl-3-methyl-5-hydroxy-6-metoxy-1,4-benzoquinol methylase
MVQNIDSALQIAISDKEIQAYLQRHPFGIGHRSDFNQTALSSLRSTLRFRPQCPPSDWQLADPARLELTPEEVSRIQNWFERLQVQGSERNWAWRVLAWKISRIPRNARSVLSIGCGAGIELILIRALLPQAELVAVDFDDKVPPAVKTALALRFNQTHFNDFLAANQGQFDLVFCNHVLEHLFEPEVTLGFVRRSLKSGGSLIAGLPIEGCSDGVFASAMRRMASKPGALHILDIGVLDAGHAWKTNPDDLKATLENQGFCKIQLHLRKSQDGLVDTFARKIGVLLYACSFGAARESLKLLSSGLIADGLVKWFLAAERRCWFGANRLKNRFAREILVQATAAHSD